nr:hypothetical protein CFP56_37294 [Quercus suber]
MEGSRPETQASFLSLPTELRLEIYSYLRYAPVDATVMDGFTDGWADHAFQTVAKRAPIARFDLPWLNLMLTSRTIAAEMSADAVNGGLSTAITATSGAQTYCLSISARWNLDAITWTSIPCPPEEVRVLDVTFHAPCDLRFWGDGGPRGIVRSLYQTLNLFLHCGPMLRKECPLRKHICLEELVLRLDVAHVCTGEDEDSPRCAVLGFRGLLQVYDLATRLCETGLLSGYVYRMSVYTEQGRKLLLASQIAEPRVPEYWAGYGFEWGIDTKTNAVEVVSRGP